MEEIEPCSDAKPRAMKESGAASTSAPITHSSEGATSGSANGQAAAMETPSSNKRPRREVKAVSYAESNAVDEDADDDVIKRGKHDESASNSACSVEPGGNGATETTFRAQHRRRQYCDPVVVSKATGTLGKAAFYSFFSYLAIKYSFIYFVLPPHRKTQSQMIEHNPLVLGGYCNHMLQHEPSFDVHFLA